MRNPTKNNQVFSLVLAFLILFNNLRGAVVEVGTEISKPLGKKKKTKNIPIEIFYYSLKLYQMRSK